MNPTQTKKGTHVSLEVNKLPNRNRSRMLELYAFRSSEMCVP